jgi:hypothetical protein
MKTSAKSKHAQIGSKSVSPLADIPRIWAPLKCRWQADPVSGALRACWEDTSQEQDAGASLDDSTEASRYRLRPLPIADAA